MKCSINIITAQGENGFSSMSPQLPFVNPVVSLSEEESIALFKKSIVNAMLDVRNGSIGYMADQNVSFLVTSIPVTFDTDNERAVRSDEMVSVLRRKTLISLYKQQGMRAINQLVLDCEKNYLKSLPEKDIIEEAYSLGRNSRQIEINQIDIEHES